MPIKTRKSFIWRFAQFRQVEKEIADRPIALAPTGLLLRLQQFGPRPELLLLTFFAQAEALVPL